MMRFCPQPKLFALVQIIDNETRDPRDLPKTNYMSCLTTIETSEAADLERGEAALGGFMSAE